MITGINHLTFSVRDLEESISFYTEVLGFELASRGDGEAHLLAGDAWVVLILDSSVRDKTLPEYSHVAFSVSAEDFAALDQRIRRSGAEIWQENRTEGDSLYFLDPNGHKLEIHTSDLEARIESYRRSPWEGTKFYT
jgi:catechol 2,3-dioxygenase-like lactoylglutathione lyase family enzyme